MSDPTPEDILMLARFCWPERPWAIRLGIRDNDEPDVAFEQHDRDCVAAAEAVLIERGLAESYGRELWSRTDDVSRSNSGMWRKYALIATASPDVRVRAMIAVVKAQKSGDQK